MKILYLQQQLIISDIHAGNDRCIYFASRWAREGIEVHFISTIPPTLHADQDPTPPHIPGVNIHRVETAYAHSMGFLRRILSFLSFSWKAWRIGKTLKDIDLVLAYTAPPTVAEIGRRLAAYHHVPFYLEVADVWPDVPIGMGLLPFPPLANYLLKRMNRIYGEANCVFTFSEDMRNMILEHVPTHTCVEVIHNGADPKFYEIPQKRSETTPVRLLYIGTLGMANQLTQLVDTLKLIPEEVRERLEILVVGSGNEEKALQDKAAAFSNIYLYPSCTRAEVHTWLEKADIGLSMFAPYPILASNSATKFFDYLAAGLPVLLNYEGWQATYLNEYQCGLPSPQGDPQALADNLQQLVLQPELRKRMGENSRRLAQQKFDRDKLAAFMLENMKPGIKDEQTSY
ncbi:MAG: glycosyltransferase family 4 protein [Bacteroidota bacterium]